MSICAFCKSIPTYFERGTNATLKALDIPQYPVEGAVFGQAHWERLNIYKKSENFQEMEVTLKLRDKGFFRTASWYSIDQAIRQIDAYLAYRIEPQKTGSKLTGSFRIVAGNDKDLEGIIGSIENFASIESVTRESEVQPYWELEHESLHDKSTGHLYEAQGNNFITLRAKGVLIAAATPIYAAATIVFNILRVALVNIYLLAYMVYEHQKAPPEVTFKQIAALRFEDMKSQTWVSIRNIIRTFFYAQGFFCGALLMIVDPSNGMKVTGLFEEHWNHRTPLSTNWWLCIPMRNFKFEGWGDPKKMGENPFRLAGCLAPRAKTVRRADGGYEVAHFSHDPQDIRIKEDKKVVKVAYHWFLNFPFCLPISF